jgi:prevent-host-death family protein
VRSVGVRELKEHASRILREIQDRGETVQITNRGKVVARLVPESTRLVRQRTLTADERANIAATLVDIDALAAEIAEYWPKGASAVDAVREQRRELSREWTRLWPTSE